MLTSRTSRAVFDRFVVCCVLLSVAATAVTSPAMAQSGAREAFQALQEQYRGLQSEHRAALLELAKFCDEKQLSEAAAEIREHAAPADANVLRFHELPRDVQPDISTDLPADERYWRTQLRHEQEEFAGDLFLLSRRALKAGLASYAQQLVRETAYHNPDHSAARKLLGYVRYGEEWVTPYTARMLRRRFVWHEKFGWLPGVHVERYENGERYYKGRWISAEREAELRRDFRNAWEIRTDHYLVKTNHSLEKGVELAAALEDFHAFFVPMFAPFFGADSEKRSQNNPYEVHYYRTREEYIEKLQKVIPQISITNGLYYTPHRVAYFFDDPAARNPGDMGTLYHEASHQLFYESQTRDRPVGERAHFWIIEGIACYMESFERENGQVSVGDPNHVRFQAARYRYLTDGYYVPLSEFAGMGMQQFQTHASIAKNYSQASGLAHFFMQYDGGRFRDALVTHLYRLYNTNPRSSHRVPTLAELTGIDYAELDRLYGEYMQAMQETIDRQRSQPAGRE